MRTRGSSLLARSFIKQVGRPTHFNGAATIMVFKIPLA
jgi:hypothetical protein